MLTSNQEALKHNENKQSFLKDLPSRVKKQIQDAFGETVNQEELIHEPLEGNEDIFEGFTEILPEELVHKNIQDCIVKKKNIYESLLFFIDLIERRKNSWEINSNEKYKDEALTTIALLSGARFNQDLFLGRGNAGHVFLAPETEGDYCIKYLHTPKRQASTIEGEFRTLSDVAILRNSFEALKIPQPHCLAKNIEGTKNFFTMETISGLTLEQLVMFPSKRASLYPNISTEKMIEILEDTSLQDALVRDLSKIHASGIVHGDIHPRNLMLDTEGNIVLIDFGNAVIPVNVSTQATYETIENVKDLDVKTLINSIKKTALLLKEKVLTK